jgi:hypothetical protein
MYRWLEIVTMIENKKFKVNDQAWAHDLEKGVEDYTDMLFEALWEGHEDEISETLSGEPFCGCSPCFWRETLFYVVPRLIVGYENGKIELED